MSKPTDLEDYKASHKHRDKVMKSLEINLEILKINTSILSKKGSIDELEKLLKFFKKVNKWLDD